MEDKCLICESHIKHTTIAGKDVYSITCPLCGHYRIEGLASRSLSGNSLNNRQRANASGWLFENQNYEISASNIDGLINLASPSFHERADKFLMALEKKTEYAGQYIKDCHLHQSWAWAININELLEIIYYLKNGPKRIDYESEKFGSKCKIAAHGWKHLEELKEINPDSAQCFVAMWFDESMNKIYNKCISKAIEDAGYKPHRVDLKEHNDKIDDEIISQIKRSRFIVADFTGHRGGVYYEAGFGKGLGLEVFWTCRKDDLENLHFDIRQYNCIDWESSELGEFRKRLSYRIESVLGRGKYDQTDSK